MTDDVDEVGAALAHELQALGSFGVVVGAQVVRLDQLTAVELAAVSRTTGVGWLDLVQQPTADLLGALGLVEACYRHVGDRVDSGDLTVAELLERVVRVGPALEVVHEAT